MTVDLKRLIIDTAKNAIETESAFFLHSCKPAFDLIDKGVTFKIKQWNDDLKKFFNQIKNDKSDPLRPPFGNNLFITKLPGNNLIVNKFMNEIGHVLFASEDNDANQTIPMTLQDFEALLMVFDAFGDGIGYYNCGPQSGNSQNHKHFQFQPITIYPLFTMMTEHKELPFEYRVEEITQWDPQSIYDLYIKLTQNLPTDSYNFIMNRKFAIVVPRTQGTHPKKIVLNAISLCGILAFGDITDPFIKENPLQVLTEACVAAKH